MSQAKHTPGPWKLARKLTADSLGVSINAPGKRINLAVVWFGPTDKTRIAGEANARLIAAAPDLLEACRKSLSTLKLAYETFVEGGAGGASEDEGDEVCAEAEFLEPAMDALTAAIAKAEGGAK